MSYQPVSITAWGGLDLSASPTATDGRALDLLDVDLRLPRELRSRDGSTRYTTDAGASPYNTLHRHERSSGSEQLLAGRGTSAVALGVLGSVSSWSTGTVIPEARRDHGTVAYNSYLYVLGGRSTTGGTPLGTWRSALVASDGTFSWSGSGSTVNALAASAWVRLNGYVYGIGGIDGAGTVSSAVEVATAGSSTLSFVAAQSLPAARAGVGAAAYNGYVYAVGGENPSGTAQATVYYASQSQGRFLSTWSTTTSLPAARSYAAVVAHNGFLYVIGGYNAGAQTTVYYAPLNSDGTVGAWSTTNVIPAGRYDAGVTMVNDRIYVVGGHNGTSPQTSIYEATPAFSGGIASWTTASTSLPAARTSFGATTVNGRIYAPGGVDASTVQNTVYYGAPANEATTSGATNLSNSDNLGFSSQGTPNAERTYAGNGTDTLRRWDGSNWTAPTATVDGTGSLAMPKGGLLATDPDSNRLVVSGFKTTTGGPNGTTSSPSHIYWSDPGDAERWDTSNTITLEPGDGQEIRALVSWHGQIFAFKNQGIWRFYGETTDAEGGTVFNYTNVSRSVGCVAWRAACEAPEGIYFLDRTGLYVVGAGAPVKVSKRVEPLFLLPEGKAPSPYSELQRFKTFEAMHWHDGQVFVSYAEGAGSPRRTLVFDTDTGEWSVWSIEADGFATFPVDDTERLFYSSSANGNHVLYIDAQATDDAGTAYTARYRSGFVDFGDPRIKKIRKTPMWGSGSPTFGWSTDYGSIERDAAVTLGTAPALRKGEHGSSYQGEVCSYKISGSGAWRVTRITPLLDGNKRHPSATLPSQTT